jgi:hypothetical protein
MRRREFITLVGGAASIRVPANVVDPRERLIGILFFQAPSQRASYQAELRAMVYGSLGSASQ